MGNLLESREIHWRSKRNPWTSMEKPWTSILKSMEIHRNGIVNPLEIRGKYMEIHGNPWNSHRNPRKYMGDPREIHGNPWARLGSARHGSARLGLARPSICQRFATDLLRILQQFVDYSPPICRRFADIYHRRSTDEPVYRRADYCTTWDFLSLYFGWIWI